jgi:ribosomal protein L11 methyltransferase
MSDAETVFSLTLDVPSSVAEQAREILAEISTAGFEERPVTQGVRFILYTANEVSLDALEGVAKQAFAALAGDFHLSWSREIRREAWRDTWTRYLTEQRLTARTLVVPMDSVPDAVRSTTPRGTLRLLRRGAFGFGEHPTTRLVARRLESLCDAGNVQDVLDVGAGTGVLAILASLRGARRAYGVDIDAPSVEIARANAVLNGVDARCRFDDRRIENVSEEFDLVLANVEAPILLELCPAIARPVVGGGRLLLSGFLTERGAEIERAYEAQGLTVCGTDTEEDWLVLEFRR